MGKETQTVEPVNYEQGSAFSGIVNDRVGDYQYDNDTKGMVLKEPAPVADKKATSEESGAQAAGPTAASPSGSEVSGARGGRTAVGSGSERRE